MGGNGVASRFPAAAKDVSFLSRVCLLSRATHSLIGSSSFLFSLSLSLSLPLGDLVAQEMATAKTSAADGM